MCLCLCVFVKVREREWKGQEAKGGREWNLERYACVKGMCVCESLVVKVRKMRVIGIGGKEEGFGKLKGLCVRRECVYVLVSVRDKKRKGYVAREKGIESPMMYMCE